MKTDDFAWMYYSINNTDTTWYKATQRSLQYHKIMWILLCIMSYFHNYTKHDGHNYNAFSTYGLGSYHLEIRADICKCSYHDGYCLNIYLHFDRVYRRMLYNRKKM